MFVSILFSVRGVPSLVLSVALLGACAPTPPAPTTAPAQPPATVGAGAPAAKATSAPAPKPTVSLATQPTAPPAAKPTVSQQARPPEKPSAEDAVAAFYQGKTLRFITGFSAGGTFDIYTRLVARHVTDYLPGNPTAVVENMTGAGGLIATNHVYNVAPKDGTVAVNLDGAVIRLQALDQEGIEFDAKQFNWLPSPGATVRVCWATKESGWTSIDEAVNSSKELVLGGLAPGSFPSDAARLLQTTLGLNLRLVEGYDGVANLNLAAKRGEVDGSCNSLESVEQAWPEELANGEIRLIAQVWEGTWPGLENVTNALALAKSDEDRRLLKAGIVDPTDLNRLFALPPGVPSERVAAFRAAIERTYAATNFKQEAERSRLSLRPVSVPRIEEAVGSVLDMTPAEKNKLKTVLQLN